MKGGYIIFIDGTAKEMERARRKLRREGAQPLYNSRTWYYSVRNRMSPREIRLFLNAKGASYAYYFLPRSEFMRGGTVHNNP